jgi:hypothetical protein
MHKEESDNKINEKNISENNIINTKVKIPKEKKNTQKNATTPKKAKKKVHFSNTKEKEKDTAIKNNIIKSKVPPLIEEKKNEKIEKSDIVQVNNSEQKSNIDEVQNTSSNAKENKEKRNWKSWSPQEKLLFYEIIANGGNYSSLQKLFKTMNDVSIYLIIMQNFTKIIENRNEKHRKNTRFLLSYVKKCKYIIKKGR